MALPWLKLWVEIDEDEKLPDVATLGAWIKVLCLARRSSDKVDVPGKIPLTVPQIAWKMRLTSDEAQEYLDYFAQQGMVRFEEGGIVVVHFEGRQKGRKPSDRPEAVRERVGRHRGRTETQREKCNAPVTPLDDQCNAPCNALVTPQNDECNAPCNADVTPPDIRIEIKEVPDPSDQVPAAPSCAAAETGPSLAELDAQRSASVSRVPLKVRVCAEHFLMKTGRAVLSDSEVQRFTLLARSPLRAARILSEIDRQCRRLAERGYRAAEVDFGYIYAALEPEMRKRARDKPATAAEARPGPAVPSAEETRQFMKAYVERYQEQ